MRLAFRVAYLGGGFAGSQMQPNARTVEGEFIAACERLILFPDWREARFAFSGRTDRGVHARGQVAAFDTEEAERALLALNPQLPRDCWCTAYAEVDESFHPRHDARSRTYRYYMPGIDLNIDEMDRAAHLFQGRHDFSCLARVEEGHSPDRVVLSSHVREEGDFTVFEVRGESFLWNMVRCMTTVLQWVGAGLAKADLVTDLLEGRCDERPAAAPAEGLILWDVEYDVPFLPLPQDRRSRAFLDATRRHHAVMERICQDLQNP
ncbi:MAG TPA: tRNA pseudouridine(38-40) synthase TruA [Methanomicrobiales archaeon]|nr:tRNA pseudouridine(38-40) synthase TruA [Methanomicrobiales archaeon]